MLRHRAARYVVSISLAACVLLVAAGCGGGGGDGGAPASTPSISNLAYSPSSALQLEGDGEITIVGTFDFTDPGGDLATLNLSSQGETLSIPIEGVAGLKSGTIEGSLLIDTSAIGSYTFEIYVTDQGGRRSNTLSGRFEIKVNDLGERWTEQSLSMPSGSTVALKRVRWLASQYIAVGEGIFVSPDAVTWSEYQNGVPAMLNDVTWMDGRFVIVGEGGTVLTSPDGSAWTQQPIPPTTSPALNGVAASGNRLVAVGTQYVVATGDTLALILTSSDGVTWEKNPQTIQAALYKVTWTGDKFIAVGSLLGAPNAAPVALLSDDGLNWTAHSAANANLSVFYDIAWNGSQFVAVGYPGIARSADGITWEQTGSGSVGGGEAIAWSGQRFLTCHIVYCNSSTDGIQWQTTQLPGVGPYVRGLTWGDTKWVAVGNSSLVLTSP